MKRIELGGERGKGKFLLVDDSDFSMFNFFSWSSDGHGYGQAHVPKSGKNCQETILAHHLILESAKDKVIDHINGDKLDCRRENLRLVTQSQNLTNSKKRKNAFSKYKGVSWYKRDKNWSAYFHIDYKKIHIGYFKSEIEAAEAYDLKAKQFFGQYARLNFAERS
jgi:hypothetical protein